MCGALLFRMIARKILLHAGPRRVLGVCQVHNCCLLKAMVVKDIGSGMTDLGSNPSSDSH